MGEKQDSRCMMRPHGDSSLQSNKQTTDMGQDIEVWPDLISAESTAGAWQNRHRTPVPIALGSSSSPTQGNGCFLCIQYSITVEQCLHSQGIAFWTVVGQKDRISRCFFSGKKSQRLEALPCCANGTRFSQEKAAEVVISRLQGWKAFPKNPHLPRIKTGVVLFAGRFPSTKNRDWPTVGPQRISFHQDLISYE